MEHISLLELKIRFINNMSGKRNWQERMDGHNPPPIFDPNRRKSKRKYVCKRNKGDHEWKPVGATAVSFKCKTVMGEMWFGKANYDSDMIERCIGKIKLMYSFSWECEKCGKQDREYSCVTNKKFDKFRYKLYK